MIQFNRRQKIVAYKYNGNMRCDVLLTNHIYHIEDKPLNLNGKTFGIFLFFKGFFNKNIEKELNLREGYSKGKFYKIDYEEIENIKEILRKHRYTLIVIDWKELVEKWLLERI